LVVILDVGFDHFRSMGCILSTEAVDDGALLPSGEVYVFVAGFRLPQPLDFIELLKGSVSAGLAAKLQALRSQVIIAADRTEARRRKAQDGKLDFIKFSIIFWNVLTL